MFILCSSLLFLLCIHTIECFLSTCPLYFFLFLLCFCNFSIIERSLFVNTFFHFSSIFLFTFQFVDLFQFYCHILSIILSFLPCMLQSRMSGTTWFPVNKKESCLQDSPPAAGRFSDILPVRRSAILSGAFLCHRTKFPMT